MWKAASQEAELPAAVACVEEGDAAARILPEFSPLCGRKVPLGRGWGEQRVDDKQKKLSQIAPCTALSVVHLTKNRSIYERPYLDLD